MTNSEFKKADIGFVGLLVSIMLLIGITLTGCGDSTLPKLQFVDNLRILAISSSPVTVQAGGTTVISALVGDPKGASRNITYAWSVCSLAQADATLTSCLSTLTTSTVTTTSTTPTLSYTNSLNSGDGLLVTLLVSAGTEIRRGVKRVPVVSATVTEQAAPSITDFTIGGSGGTSTYSASSSQSYALEILTSTLVGTNYFTTWLTDGGTLNTARTTTTFKNGLAGPNASGTYHLYAVLNDGLGGVAFSTRTFVIP